MIALVQSALGDFIKLGREAPPARRILYAAGLFLLVSGFFHLGIFFMQGGSWEGPLSWRKPILFGFSGGVTLLSLAWCVGLVVETPWALYGRWLKASESPFCLLLALAMGVEVALITLQTWRGVPSHFNQTTLPDTAIFYLMGLLILLVTIQVAALALASFLPLPAPADTRWAARAGLLLLLLGCLLGFWVLYYGVDRVKAGRAPEIYGSHGVMKFPHGLPIHGLQYLALQSWLLQRARLGEGWRVRLIQAASLGLLLVTVYGLGQTLAGRSRFDFTPESAFLFFFSAGLVLLPFAIAAGLGLSAWRQRLLSAVSSPALK